MTRFRHRTLADDLFGDRNQREPSIDSNRKGSRGELMLAKLFTAWTGQKFNRVPKSGGLNWGADNRVAGDIVAPFTFDFPFTVECKNYRELRLDEVTKLKGGTIRKFWLQAEKDAYKVGKFPLLLVKDNKSKFALLTILRINKIRPSFCLEYKNEGLILNGYFFEPLMAEVSFTDFRSNFVNSK